MVGVESRSVSDDHSADTPVSINEVPWSDPSRGQPLPVNGRRVPEDGALCRPLIGARRPSCQWGREQAPWSGEGADPGPGPEGCSRPDVRAGMLAGSRCDPRAECTRVVTCERVRDPLRNSLYFSLWFSAFTLAQKSAITTIRIELCSARSSKVALM